MFERPRQCRALSKAELEQLQQALGAPVDPEYLAHWVSAAIEDAVWSASNPTPRQLRDRLRAIEQHGRQLLSAVDEPKLAWLLSERTDLAKFRRAAARFCDDTAALVQELESAVVKPSRPRTPAVLKVFVDRMIGIAKKAGVRPSTPSRRGRRQTVDTPGFFKFLCSALRIGRQVIQTSQLPDHVKAAATAKLQQQSFAALIKVVVKVRGRIANYTESPKGLVESDVIEPAGK